MMHTLENKFAKGGGIDMKIALVGYGQMGHMLRSVAEKRNHKVVLTVDTFAEDADFKPSSPAETAEKIAKSGAEGIIEFSHPSSVIDNIAALLPLKLPLVVGTTGWNDKREEVKKLAEKNSSYIFHSANYSIGVNLFYKIIEQASSLISKYDEYDCALWEAHHTKKLDSPSGTALELAQIVLNNMKSKKTIVTESFHERPKKEELHVSSTRLGNVPGTHTVYFDSSADTIELKHIVRNREGLALGAVRALEWLRAKIDESSLAPGMFSMENILN